MFHSKLPFKITVLLYIIVFIIPVGFFSTFNSFGSIKEDSIILQKTGWVQGTLPLLSKRTLDNDTTSRIDTILAKYHTWVNKNNNSEHYIGIQTLEQDMLDTQQCWDSVKNSQETMNPSCSEKLRTLSITIQEIVKSKQKKTINMFYISLGLTMLVVLFSIYFLRLYMQYQLKKHSIYDHDTQLYNRKYFEAEFHTLCARSERHDYPLSVLFISMSEVNKKSKKRVLKKIGEIIAHASRESDVACRFDDDHFVIIMPFDTVDNGQVLESRIRELLEQQSFNVEPELSFGFATTEFNKKESDKAFVKRAKEALV